MSAEIFVGMEVSQACAEMGVHPGTSFQIPYDEPEIAHAVEQLHTLQPTLILLEATGGGACRRRTAGRGHQSSAGPWDCPSDRAVGQDRSARRTSPRTLCSSDSAPGPRPVPDEQMQALAALLACR
jgi:hypothetical protein